MRFGVLCVLGISSGWLFAQTAAPKGKGNPTPAPLPAPTMGAVVLTVGEKYILPAQISRPAGTFMLVIKNYSDLKNLTLHIKPHGGGGTEVLAAPLDSRGGNFDAVLNLPAGTYDVTEPSNAAIKATIVLK
jgi:hypothetical protein